MKLVVIGPIDTREKIRKVMENNFTTLSFSEYSTEEAEENFLEILSSCDGILFTGISIHHHFIEKFEVRIPNIYIPHSADTLMKALFELKTKFPNTDKLSIDVLKNTDINELLEEFEIKELSYNVLEYDSELSQDEFFQFHKKYQNENSQGVAITGLAGIYKKLKENGYNVIRLFPTQYSIKQKIDELISEIILEYTKESMIGVQILHVNHSDLNSSYKILEINSYVEYSIVEYLKAIDGSIFNIGQTQYIIFSTWGAIKKPENSKQLLNLLEKFEEKKIEVFVGNGFGKTAYESEKSAKKALEYSKKQNKNSAYEVIGNKVKGPLLNAKEIEYDFLLKKEVLEEISKKTDLNPIYFTKIYSLMNKYNSNLFSSDELAMYLNISLRTANRVIKKLLDCQLAEVEYYENNNAAGRPKKIVKFKF